MWLRRCALTDGQKEEVEKHLLETTRLSENGDALSDMTQR